MPVNVLCISVFVVSDSSDIGLRKEIEFHFSAILIQSKRLHNIISPIPLVFGLT